MRTRPMRRLTLMQRMARILMMRSMMSSKMVRMKNGGRLRDDARIC
jgi:hypothetical protein